MTDKGAGRLKMWAAQVAAMPAVDRQAAVDEKCDILRARGQPDSLATLTAALAEVGLTARREVASPGATFVNRNPEHLKPDLYPLVWNREWEALVALPLSGVHWRCVMYLLTRTRGSGRMVAARDAFDDGAGYEAFEDASGEFGCDAAAVEAWQIVNTLELPGGATEANKRRVRCALRELIAAGVVRRHSVGTGGSEYTRQAQVLSVDFDPTHWDPGKLGLGRV